MGQRFSRLAEDAPLLGDPVIRNRGTFVGALAFADPAAACPALAVVRDLAAEFRRLLTAHDVTALDAWLAAAEQSELRSLAVGLRRDVEAVRAALRFPWSNGQVEGQVNRLNLVERTMYGRASYALLRRRFLAA